MSKRKNDDFMKMLAPQSIEEFEEILKKYPVSDKPSKEDISMKNKLSTNNADKPAKIMQGKIPVEDISANIDSDMNTADEPVKVIREAPKRRRKILYAAAALILVFGIARSSGIFEHHTNCGFSYANTDADMLNDTVPDVSGEPDENIQVSCLPDTDETITPIAPITDERKKSVYFASQFPYIIYADENKCIFSAGMGCLFVYDFGKSDIVFSADIKETLCNAGKIPENTEYEFVNFGAYLKDDGLPVIVCSLFHELNNEHYNYIVDTENDSLYRISDALLDEYNAVEFFYIKGHIEESDNDDGTAKTDDIFDNINDALYPTIFPTKPTKEGWYVYLANNGLCNDAVPGEESQLPMIDIVRFKEENGEKKTERFRPFEIEDSTAENDDNSADTDEIYEYDGEIDTFMLGTSDSDIMDTPKFLAICEENGISPFSSDHECQYVNMTPAYIAEKYNFRIFKCESCFSGYLVYSYLSDDRYLYEVYPLGMYFGGFGALSFAVADLDMDGNIEIYYTSSWGSGMHHSVISYFDTKDRTIKELGSHCMGYDMTLSGGDENEHRLTLHKINSIGDDNTVKNGEMLGEIGFNGKEIVLVQAENSPFEK